MATRPGTDNGACEAFGRRLYLFLLLLSARSPAWPARSLPPCRRGRRNVPAIPTFLERAACWLLEPGALTRVGLMQYPQTLPLADKEVVLTFDDGPLPRYSNQVLDILAAQCVQVTYFLVGQMARTYPGVVRRIYEAGHSIGTHSEDHPSGFQKLPIEKVREEIDEGIADVSAALGDPQALAPFSAFPAWRAPSHRGRACRAVARGLQLRYVADDWHRASNRATSSSAR